MEAAMMNTKDWFSPKSGGGSFVYSILAHGALYGLLIVGFGIGFGKTEPKQEYLDLGYQTFDAPPVPEKQEHQVKHVEETVKNDSKALPDNSPKELQDEKGDVAGAQKAAPVAAVANESNGNSASTPYYKIKPKYPKAAIISGTEGWVLLEVDIKEDGSVENVRVVDGEQRNLFGQEARRAVEQWKYRPFTDTSGHVVKKIDHQVRVDFKLNEIESSGS
jgi:TonB family protein